ncbi:MAG: Crp/Fnr family transcriptional regulator [Kiritimatiellia bacterium]
MELFDGFTRQDLKRPLGCFGARRLTAAAGEILVHEGDAATHFGLVLAGAVNVVRYTPDGRERLLAHLGAGEVFGTAFVLGGSGRYFANIIAAQPTTVLMLSGARMLTPCATRCTVHIRLLSRLLEIVARRNSRLAQKIDCLSQRSTADKLMAYLHQQAEDAGDKTFEIPFTRQQLADYLNVDRAALCTEITRLREGGRLKTRRRTFTLP